MRGGLLAIVAVSLPLLCMLLVWRWLASSQEAVPVAEPSPAVTTQQAATPPAPPRLPTSSPAVLVPLSRPSPTLADASWLSVWLRRIRDDPDVQLKAAALTLSDRQYASALTAFDRVLVRQPDAPLPLFGKAMALVGLGRNEDALPLFERVIALEPENIPARFNCGVALLRTGQLAQAATAFQELLRRRPDHVQAKFNLAVTLQGCGKNSDAIVIWRELTAPPLDQRLGPTSRCDAWFHRGEAAMALYLGEEAEQCFESTLAREPGDTRAWCNLGIARAASGKRDSALSALKQALNIDAKLVPALNQLAFVNAAIYRDTGKAASHKAALQACDQSLAADPAQSNIRALRDTLRAEEPER